MPYFLQLSSAHFPTPTNLIIGSNEVDRLLPKTANAPSPVLRLNVLDFVPTLFYAAIAQSDLTPKPNGNQKDPPAIFPSGWSVWSSWHNMKDLSS